MLLLFKYIVFLLFLFNINALNAAQITFEPYAEDELQQNKEHFIGAVSLPHPVQLRDILADSGNSSLGRLVILGQYFDARYPGDAINTDFTEEVELIFPDLAPTDVQKTMKNIRTAVRLYRFSREKINDFKQQKLAPKDPPLVASDDEYAIVGDTAYVPTKENEVAIIPDFKKVIGYGSNQREIEAMEAYTEQIYSQRKTQTDFERFHSMLRKLDWKDVFSYGVTRPSPFVGNAGIGTFEMQDDIKARLISDTARIGNQQQIIVGLHVDMPLHRFMLDTNLSSDLHKPEIKLINTTNIENYEVFEPMPIQMIAPELIGIYRGNFAFPIKISLKEKNKPVIFQAQFTFENCDSSFDCKTNILTPSLELEAMDEGKPIMSSMSNFIHQSLYNIPQENNKNLEINHIDYTLDDTGNVAMINFDFLYHAQIKNFALFLENEDNVLFQMPTIIVQDKHIYTQIKPLKNAENLLSKPLTLTARLNNFETIRKKIELNNIPAKYRRFSLLGLFLCGVLVAISFYLTPCGFALLNTAFFLKTNIKTSTHYFGAKLISLLLLLSFVTYRIHLNPNLVYADFSCHIFYLSLAFISTVAFLFYFNASFIKKTHHPIFFGIIFALFICLLIPISHLLGSHIFVEQYLQGTLIQRIILLSGFLFGLITPEISAFYVLKFKTNQKLTELSLLFSKTLLYGIICIFLLQLILLLSLKSFFVMLFIFILVSILLKYFFYFLRALYQTNLKAPLIARTEKIVATLIFICIFLFAYASSHLTSYHLQKSDYISTEDILKRLRNGENVLIAVNSPTCLMCLYNNITVFNQKSLNTLQEKYHLSFLVENTAQPNAQTIQLLKKYKKFQRPLYVLYMPLVPNGIILPDILTSLKLQRIINTFQIYPSSSSSKSDAVKSLNTNLR